MSTSVPLPMLAREIDACLDKADAAQEKARDFRVSAGRKLLEAKKRVKAGELDHNNWSRWVRDNVKKSKRDCDRCIKLVTSDNPEKAREQEKATTRKQVAKTRERQKKNGTYVCLTSRSNSSDVQLQTAKSAFLSLTKDQQRDFLIWAKEKAQSMATNASDIPIQQVSSSALAAPFFSESYQEMPAIPACLDRRNRTVEADRCSSGNSDIAHTMGRARASRHEGSPEEACPMAEKDKVSPAPHVRVLPPSAAMTS